MRPYSDSDMLRRLTNCRIVMMIIIIYLYKEHSLAFIQVGFHNDTFGEIALFCDDDRGKLVGETETETESSGLH